jgi:hypothetical protein
VIVGYRVAVALREDYPNGAPPRASRDWLRVVRSILTDGNGLALECDQHPGRTFRTRIAAAFEAMLWVGVWYVRVVRVVRR